MLIIVGSMQGTMVSLASMASFGSSASERSHYSLVRRGCLSKGNWVKKKRWHCVSLPMCKYSATTATALVSEQSNTYRGGKSDDSDVGFLRKPTPKPVLGSTWELVTVMESWGLLRRGIGEGREVRDFEGE